MLDLSTSKNKELKSPNFRPDSRGLGFVAVYFNIAGYTSLRQNFERFLERFSWLGDRLLVVELAYFSRDFEMTGKHSNMVQVRSDSVLWHKENLMNVGTRYLRSQGFRNVGWLDGDVIIDGDGEEWFGKVEAALVDNCLVHVFESISYHFSDQTLNKYGALAEHIITGEQATRCYTAGLGWAVRGDIWDQCEWYDLDIFGAGDRWLLLGSLIYVINFEEVLEFKGQGAMNHLPHFLSWVEKWRKLVQKRLSFLKGVSATCEAHGSCADRQFVERSAMSAELGFNPRTDLIKDDEGILNWSPTASNDLRLYMLNYFVSRNEDS